MNVIIDTNVLVSGIFFKGPPFEIMIAWKNKRFKLVTSHEIIEEYKRVVFELSDNFPTIDVSDIIDKITIHSKLSFSLTYLHQTRTKKHWTQEQLAKKIKSSQSRVAKMEKGDPSVSVDLLIKSLFALGTSKNDLAKAIQ